MQDKTAVKKSDLNQLCIFFQSFPFNYKFVKQKKCMKEKHKKELFEK